MAGQHVLLTIQRQVIGELVHDDVRQQSGPSQAALDRIGRRLGRRHTVFAAGAGVFGVDVPLHRTSCRARNRAARSRPRRSGPSRGRSRRPELRGEHHGGLPCGEDGREFAGGRAPSFACAAAASSAGGGIGEFIGESGGAIVIEEVLLPGRFRQPLTSRPEERRFSARYSSLRQA